MTTIIVLALNKPIGACQSVTIKETKADDESTTSVMLKISRIRLSRLQLNELFEGGVFHMISQKYPMHISILEDSVETHIHNVWLTSISTSFTTGEWIVAEGVEAEAEYVKSNQSSGR